MDLLRCVLCELDVRHEHLDGQIPVTPCRPCFRGLHDDCDPRAPYWCACDCGLKET